MINENIKLLDVVALLEDMPELNLYRGQVGTVVEEYEPGVFEVEFSDFNGRAYALETLQAKYLMILLRCCVFIPTHKGMGMKTQPTN